jgi:hypothetical protein
VSVAASPATENVCPTSGSKCVAAKSAKLCRAAAKSSECRPVAAAADAIAFAEAAAGNDAANTAPEAGVAAMSRITSRRLTAAKPILSVTVAS